MPVDSSDGKHGLEMWSTTEEGRMNKVGYEVPHCRDFVQCVFGAILPMFGAV